MNLNPLKITDFSVVHSSDTLHSSCILQDLVTHALSLAIGVVLIRLDSLVAGVQLICNRKFDRMKPQLSAAIYPATAVRPI